MAERGIGARVNLHRGELSAALLLRAERLGVADLSNATRRLYAIDAGLRPVAGAVRMVGAALTVKVPPGDNLLVLAALELARPGEIIVVDCGGDVSAAMAGELLVRHAMQRKLAGLLVDGAVRDAETLRGLDFPVFARAVVSRGAEKRGPGEINVPIVCGRMVVAPGDLVAADLDGAIALGTDVAEEVVAAAEAARAKEALLRADIADGKFGQHIRRRLAEAGITLDDTPP